MRSVLVLASAALAAFAISLAGPVAGAGATTAPTSAQVAAALDTLVTPTVAVTLSSDITGLQGGLSTAGLSTIDSALNRLPGAIQVSLPGASIPTAPALEATLGAIGALLPASPSAAQRQAVTECETAVLDTGTSALLVGLSSGANVYSAESELSALQQFDPGESTFAGDTKAIAVVVSTLATEATSPTDSATLSSVASSMAGNTTVTVAQLQSAITGLASVTSSAASGTAGVSVAQVAHALASQLAQAGSVMGALASVGAAFSGLSDPGDTTTAVNQLAVLGGLMPGEATPMTAVGGALAAIAGTPGVSGTTAEAALSSVASALATSTAAPATQLWSAVTSLDAVAASLPADLDTLVLDVTYDIQTSPVVFGAIDGLLPAQVTSALSELAALASLGPGAVTPTLPGISEILARVAYDVPGADPSISTALGELIGAIADNSLDADELAGAAEALTYVVAVLPTPEKTAIAGLTTELSADATAMGATADDASGATPTAPASPSANEPLGPQSTATPRHSAGLLQQTRRSGNTLTLTVYCSAVARQSCRDRITAGGRGLHTLSRTVTIPATATRVITLKLAPLRPRNRGTTLARRRSRAPITLTVSSAGYRATRTLR